MEGRESQVVGDYEGVAGVLASTIENENRLGSGGDVAGDLQEMGVQDVGVGVGHDQGGADGAGRADGAEQIGRS